MAITYRQAGVDIDAGDALVERIAHLAKPTRILEVVSGIGGFAGLCALASGLVDPILVSGSAWEPAAEAFERAATRARAAGEALTAEERLYSTLRYAGEGLLRLAQKGAGTAQTEAIEARMVKLLGPDWRGDAAGQESRQ